MKKQKRVFRNFCTYHISIQTLYYFVEAPLAAITVSSLLGYDATSLAFGEFLPFFTADPLNICQAAWEASLHSYFQVSPEKFDRVQVWALAGPLNDIQRLVPKPLLRCCCLIWR